MGLHSILVIDDEPDVLFTIKEICLAGGWEPMLASNGRHGCELFEAHRPNLVIVDYHMPGFDGLTTVKRIRQQDEAASILVLTVDERQEIAEKFMIAGATDFAVKPIRSPDLISRIKINLRINDIQRKHIDEMQQVFVDKGISAATLSIICDFLKEEKGALTIEEITGGVDLAYQTVHRYLQYLIEEGRVKAVPHYGKVGRPKNKYILL